MIHTFVNLFAAPRLAYEQLRRAPLVLIPLLLLVFASGITTLLYFQWVDPDLLIDDLVAQAGEDLSDAEQVEARAGIEGMSLDTMKWAGVVGGSVGLLVMLVAHAGYFYLVSMFNGTKIGFKPWLSFVTWSNMPTLLALIACIATVLFATSHVSISGLNPLSLTNLLNFQSDNAAIVRWMDNIDLTRIWSIALMVLGYRVWTDSSWLLSGLVVLAPVIVVFGTLFTLAI